MPEFEKQVRAACDDYQAGRISATEFVERVISIRNKVDMAKEEN